MEKFDVIEREIEQAIDSLFPHGEGRTTRPRVEHWLNTVAKRAFSAGKTYALTGLMTVRDVAQYYGISKRRARALIANRHERFAVGMQVGNSWLVHRDELPEMEPDEKYRRK